MIRWNRVRSLAVMSQQRPPRWFSADDLLNGRVSLDGYPFRFIWITATPSGGGINVVSGGPSARAARVDMVMSAAEMLEARGWRVVNFEDHGQIAYLRAS